MRRLNYNLLIFIIAGLIAGWILVWQWSLTKVQAQETSIALISSLQKTPEVIPSQTKPPARMVKGLYLTAYSANNPQKIDEIIALLDKTELNSVVIDIKDYSGKILYNSQIPLVKKINAQEKRIKDIPALIKKLHEHDIYVIARQTVFQDPELASKKPEWAIKNNAGNIWRDKNGLSWVDMTNKKVWEYNLAIAKEAIGLGFDEVNFDYMRFPSDGNIKEIAYTDKSPKSQVMRNFFNFLGGSLTDFPAWISVDLFGLTMEHTDDLGIGQRIIDTLDNFDYVCPMMYPSHYYAGHLNFTNPADHPAEVIENGMKKGAPLFENKHAQLRPWLQAFNLGATYDAEKIRAQIDMVEKYADSGWLLWNASNKYTEAGLKLE